MVLEANDLVRAFQAGRGMEIPLSPRATKEMHGHLGIVGRHLAQFSVGSSFTWVPGEDSPTRQACWVVNEGSSPEPFMTDPNRLAGFDHEGTGGQRGLQALSDPVFHESLLFLTSRANQAISAAAAAIGIQNLLPTGWTRYRISRYSGAAGGIGPHFDTNPLSAVLTDAQGLQEIRYDGTIYPVSPNAISLMSGYLLHVATAGGERPSLPILHAVKRDDPDVPKVTVAAFWNFPPDPTDIPYNKFGPGFHYDSSVIPPDIGPYPGGPLYEQWAAIARAHGKTIIELAKGTFERRGDA